jgi:biotin transport system substrate-specific component
MTDNRKHNIYYLSLTALFAAVIAVCSWISLPVFAVPVTLQTFAVFSALLILGGKYGTLSVLVYILLGAVGAPVFSGFKGGISALAGPTGGYIVGFLLTTVIYMLFTRFFGEKVFIKVLSLLLGLLSCYAFGTIWFVFVYGKTNGAIGFGTAVSMCVLPFIIPDLIKLFAALALSKGLKKAL